MKNKIRVAITGLGSRGYDTYATIIKKFSDDMVITAVADPRKGRIEKFKKEFDIPAENCFSSSEELLSK